MSRRLSMYLKVSRDNQNGTINCCVMDADEQFMRLALEQAALGESHGEVRSAEGGEKFEAGFAERGDGWGVHE